MASSDMEKLSDHDQNDDDDFLFVAAIDFGTTHSGYAFSGKSRPNAVNMNKNWGQEMGFAAYKCPTCVLTDPKGKFVSFGYTAENDFCVKCEDDQAEGYNLFRHFKMMLNKDQLTRDDEVMSTTGTKRRAIDVFAMALQYFKGDIFKVLKQAQVETLDIDEIKWVITVPAIWRDVAKRFMREAAFQAGMIKDVESKRLIIALEPEAASLFCRDLQIRLGPSEEDKYFKEGKRYMVVDAGGGTVDITVHEVVDEKKIRELFYATGGPWGALLIDKNFEALLSEIFGESMMQEFKDDFLHDWMHVMLSFERAKMSTSQEATTLQLPYNFHGKFKKEYPNKDFDHFVKSRSDQQVTSDSGYFSIKATKMKSFFDHAIAKTVGQIQNILQQVSGIDTILLVGGLGQSCFLREAIEKQFAPRKVITPHEAQLATVKGAVLFGHDPSVISTRVARVTYGIGVMLPFDKSKHKDTYKIYDYGQEMCNNLFRLSIRKQQKVETGKVVECDLNVNEESQKRGWSTLTLYCTPRDDAMYTTDPGVEKLAYIKVPLRSKETRSKLAVHMEFGTTELLFKAQDKERKEWVEVQVDFLKGKD